MSRLMAMAKGIRNPGIALVLVTVLVSGISNFVNFHAAQGTNVDAWITLRNAFVVLLLLPLVLVPGSAPRRPQTRAEWCGLVLVGLLGGAVPFLLYFHGFQLAASQGGAASASFGYRSLFLIASLLAVVVLRERVSRRFLPAAGLLLLGNALLLSVTGPLWTDGSAYVLVATALWAGEYTMSKRLLRSLSSSTVALGRMGFGASFLLLYLAGTGQVSAVAGFTGADWMWLALSGLLLFAFVSTWYAALRSVDLSLASGLLVLAFPITWILGVVGAGNAFTMGEAAGVAAVVGGTFLLLGTASVRGVLRGLTRWLRPRARDPE